MEKTIILEKYNPQWPVFFKKESQKIKSVMRRDVVEIYHVGSTSVPKLSAKPIIDMILVTQDLESARKFLTSEALGYRYKGEYNLPLRDLYGKKDKFEIYLHVHLVDNPEIDLNLSFRDYLRNNERAREKYELVKGAASKNQNSIDKTETGITKYNLLKNGFIISVLKTKVDFFCICARFATQYDELAFFNQIKSNFLTKFIAENSLFEQSTKRIVLYKGVDLVGAAELMKINLNEILINFAWTNDNQKLLRKLLSTIESWAKTRTKATLLQAKVENTQLQVYLDLGFVQSIKSGCFVKEL